jgi:hypothetical protein
MKKKMKRSRKCYDLVNLEEKSKKVRYSLSDNDEELLLSSFLLNSVEDKNSNNRNMKRTLFSVASSPFSSLSSSLSSSSILPAVLTSSWSSSSASSSPLTTIATTSLSSSPILEIMNEELSLIDSSSSLSSSLVTPFIPSAVQLESHQSKKSYSSELDKCLHRLNHVDLSPPSSSSTVLSCSSSSSLPTTKQENEKKPEIRTLLSDDTSKKFLLSEQLEII